jgi:hypothetical protein
MLVRGFDRAQLAEAGSSNQQDAFFHYHVWRLQQQMLSKSEHHAP